MGLDVLFGVKTSRDIYHSEDIEYGLMVALEQATNAIETAAGHRVKGRKPDVQIMEEIFREVGPLHVTDLVPIGQSRGMAFNGKKKASLQARDKLVGSKRFHLFGNNVWGLPDQELPR